MDNMTWVGTPREQLASVALGRPVRSWIWDRRSEGLSWQAIARRLALDTNGRIEVTHETVRAWGLAAPRALDQRKAS